MASYLDSRLVCRYLALAVAKVYIVTFRSNDDRRPSKFIVLADNMKAAINVAWDDRIYVPR